MNELRANNQIIETETKQISFGSATYIRAKHNIDHNGHQINMGAESIIAVKVYEQNQNYKLIYLIIDSNGAVNNILHETEGVLPGLFKSPKNEVWISLMPYHPDKDMEISIPFYENGNGWFIMRNNEIIECFMNNLDQAYTNPLNNQIIDFEFKDLILSGANKTKENAYALTFYPRTENREPNKTIIVLNRNVL